MKYDREWLERVNDAKQIIPKIQELIPKIPEIRDRKLIADQFSVVVEDFGGALMAGRDTSWVEVKIYELGALAAQLVNGDDGCLQA